MLRPVWVVLGEDADKSSLPPFTSLVQDMQAVTEGVKRVCQHGILKQHIESLHLVLHV